MAPVNRLGEIKLETAAELKPPRRRKRTTWPEGGKRSQIARDVRAGRRKPPPVPKNKSLVEIDAMPADSPEFKHKGGSKRKDHDATGYWKDQARADHQKRRREARARSRKLEAKVTVAVSLLEKPVTADQLSKGIHDEDRAVAEGILDLADWDTEELIRGYRRNRNGKFGAPPKYIPREVQEAAFRALVRRGDRRLKAAYYKAIEELVEIAHNGGSEKVKLDAIKELMNRVVGKVPDKMLVARDEPWEDVLAESLVPLGEALPLDLEMDDEGVAALMPASEDDYMSGDEERTSATTVAATVVPALGDESPSSPRIVSEVRVIPPGGGPRA